MSLILYKLNLNINIRWSKYMKWMFENAHRSPRQLSNSNLRVISLHENIANIFLRSFEVTRTKAWLLKDCSLIHQSYIESSESQFTIWNGKSEWKNDGPFVTFSSSTAIKSVDVLVFIRFLYSVAIRCLSLMQSCRQDTRALSDSIFGRRFLILLY